MKTHELKIWPEYFEAKLQGIKPWEIRLNDRNFNVGDKMRLREWNLLDKEYTGREMTVEITYIYFQGNQVIMSDTSAQQPRNNEQLARMK